LKKAENRYKRVENLKDQKKDNRSFSNTYFKKITRWESKITRSV